MDNYKEKYNRALRKALDLYNQGLINPPLEYIFPELKESEDERIRKWIIRNLQYLMDRSEGFVKEDLQERIAWLEKQGECSWKPTEEQFEALDYAYNSCSDTERGNYYEGVLETLIDDLHRLEKQGEQKSTNKVEPKFKVGDKV